MPLLLEFCYYGLVAGSQLSEFNKNFRTQRKAVSYTHLDVYKRQVCDLLAVQCYRYSEDAYRNTVLEVLNHIKMSSANSLFALGMILMEGSNSKMTPELRLKQIKINRDLGLNGEIYFYNKALNNSKFKKF